MIGVLRKAQLLRIFVLVAGAGLLAACTTADYAGVNRSPLDYTALGGQSAQRRVEWRGRERPGTVIIDTRRRTLSLVQKGNEAVEYDVGVGKEGFQWSGSTSIARKSVWPDWTPPDQMLKRRPNLPRFMRGGPANPLGARAMYLGGSLYRIHGSNEPQTIGQAVSSGCIRMHNADVMDLYERVRPGTAVIVRR